MKLIIAGSRDFTGHGAQAVVDEWALKLFIVMGVTEVVSGKAPGADALGELWAAEMGITVKPFPAAWEIYGNGAGPRRNVVMAEYGDFLLAFPSIQSKGTLHMIEMMHVRNKPYLVVPI